MVDNWASVERLTSKNSYNEWYRLNFVLEKAINSKYENLIQLNGANCEVKSKSYAFNITMNLLFPTL